MTPFRSLQNLKHSALLACLGLAPVLPASFQAYASPPTVERLGLQDLSRSLPGMNGARPTIDSMRTSSFGGYAQSYAPTAGLMLIGSPRVYYLSDQTNWSSGAGYAPTFNCLLDHTEVAADTFRYYLRPPADSVIFLSLDYDNGYHSAQGTLTDAGPLVLVATRGNSVATLSGLARIRDNVCSSAGEALFNYFSSTPGRIVPFSARYTNLSQSWTPGAFDSAFSYQFSAVVDFTHPLPPSGLLSLEVRGPSIAGVASPAQYCAIASYWGGLRLDVTPDALWSVSAPSGVTASVTAGQLTVVSMPGSSAVVAVTASYGPSGGAVQGACPVQAYLDPSFAEADRWPMFQADAAHTGYRPVVLHPERFSLRWAKNIGNTAVNPVTAADGKVFCSRWVYSGHPGQTLQAIDAGTGTSLWAKDFGSVFSVNPPAYLDGLVYVQTCNNEFDTWLWAFAASDGSQKFRVPFEAQWERYYAPSFFAHKVYIDGGEYGGMYGFDAYTSQTEWYAGGLPQYDQWTPALDSLYAYAYLGNYSPALYAIRRVGNGIAFSIPDPDFGLSTWSMNAAVVLGSQADAIATQTGRLLSFDLAGQTIRWIRTRAFSGQPAVAHGVIYVVDGGRLVAIDEATGADLWSWQAPGTLTGPMIVTDSHLLISSAAMTYAVSLVTHASEWAYPSAGALALGNGCLYIATPYGSLSAIDVGPVPTATELVQFDAEGGSQGVRLRWEFARPEEVASVAVERAVHEAGEWIALKAVADVDGKGSTLIDATARAGETYWYRLKVTWRVGGSGILGPIRGSAALQRDGLLSVGPQPAGSRVRLTWSLVGPGGVRIRVMDVQGRVVATLVDGSWAAGLHTVESPLPSRIASGVYFVTFDSSARRESRRLVVSR